MESLYTRVAEKNEFPYVVNIQNRDVPSYSQSVGVLIQAQLILATCNIFKPYVYSSSDVEEARFKNFRVVAGDGELIKELEAVYAVTPQVRFIENVYLHPECAESYDSIQNPLFDTLLVWKKDLAIVRLSFAFHMGTDAPKLGMIQFKSQARELTAKRLHKFMEFSDRSAVCAVVGWGRKVTIPNRNPYDIFSYPQMYPPSDRLLVSSVRLSPLRFCETFCKEHKMYCDLTNETKSGRVVCAKRTQNQFVLDKTDLSHFPCTGTEGSPLICYGADNGSDVYGILNYLPNESCEYKWPLVFTRIDDVSHFVISIIGKAQNLGWSSLQLILPITIHLTINYLQ